MKSKNDNKIIIIVSNNGALITECFSAFQKKSDYLKGTDDTRN